MEAGLLHTDQQEDRVYCIQPDRKQLQLILVRLTQWMALPTSHEAVVLDNKYPLRTSSTQGSLHPPHWTKHLQGRVCNPETACQPCSQFSYWKGPLDKWCGHFWPWFRKPLVHPLYSHENLQHLSLTEHSGCQMPRWPCTIPCPSAWALQREFSLVCKTPRLVLKSRQGSVVLHIGGGMLGRTKLS